MKTQPGTPIMKVGGSYNRLVVEIHARNGKEVGWMVINAYHASKRGGKPRIEIKTHQESPDLVFEVEKIT